MGTEFSEIKFDILKGRRAYFIEKVKGPLHLSLRIAVLSKGNRVLNWIRLLWAVWCIVRSVNRYPVPTKANTKKKNTHAIIDTYNEFFEKYDVPCRQALFRAVSRIHIDTYEHDDPYSEPHDWFLKQLIAKCLTGEYELPGEWSPTTHWKDPVAIEALARARIDLMMNLDKKEQ